jgi:FAD-linked oxidoreductase
MVRERAQAGRHMRVTGSAHSFTPLVATNDTLIVMDKISGIVSVDEATNQVKVLGGTRLKTLGDELLKRGLAQENLGDIDAQTITGAISTGTHGTGVRFGNIATQVAAITLVTASGAILELSPQSDPDAFKAAQVSVGALGVIAAVTLNTVPAKRLRYQTKRETLKNVMANLERYKADNSHFEFFWLPNTPWTQAKLTNETNEQPTSANLWTEFNRVVMENGVFWALSEVARMAPPASKAVSAISAWGIAPTTAVDYSHRLFATPRAVKFQEMEYNIPTQHFPAVMGELLELIARRDYHVHFPIECRFVKGDDIWLSPAFQRDSAYVAAHMYKGMRYEEYFHDVEQIYQHYDGRPHWGKMHTLDTSTLASRYPRWADFQRVRQRLDPQGVFLNDYLRQLFGV